QKRRSRPQREKNASKRCSKPKKKSSRSSLRRKRKKRPVKKPSRKHLRLKKRSRRRKTLLTSRKQRLPQRKKQGKRPNPSRRKLKLRLMLKKRSRTRKRKPPENRKFLRICWPRMPLLILNKLPRRNSKAS